MAHCRQMACALGPVDRWANLVLSRGLMRRLFWLYIVLRWVDVSEQAYGRRYRDLRQSTCLESNLHHGFKYVSMVVKNDNQHFQRHRTLDGVTPE